MDAFQENLQRAPKFLLILMALFGHRPTYKNVRGNTAAHQRQSNFKIHSFHRSVTSPFAVQLFLLPFSCNCSMHNIGFSDSGTSSNICNLPSSAIYRAPPFTQLQLKVTRHPEYSTSEPLTLRYTYTKHYNDYGSRKGTESM